MDDAPSFENTEKPFPEETRHLENEEEEEEEDEDDEEEEDEEEEDKEEEEKDEEEPMTMGKKLQSSWPLSSDEKDHEEISDNKLKNFCKDKNLADIFTSCHANLVSVVMVLMMHFNLQLAVATPFIDPEEKYIRTGEYNYSACEMKLVSAFYICAVGSIEKVLVAGLQVLYANGAKNKKGTDYRVHFYRTKKNCNILVNFQFNEVEVNMKIVQWQNQRTISLYIED
jgi:hypothetical protein